MQGRARRTRVRVGTTVPFRRPRANLPACSSRAPPAEKPAQFCRLPPCACSPDRDPHLPCSPPCSSPRRSRPWRSPREGRVRSAERRQRASQGRHGPAEGDSPDGARLFAKRETPGLVRPGGRTQALRGRRHRAMCVPSGPQAGRHGEDDREQTLAAGDMGDARAGVRGPECASRRQQHVGGRRRSPWALSHRAHGAALKTAGFLES